VYPILAFNNRNFFWTPFREGAKHKEIYDQYVILGYTLFTIYFLFTVIIEIIF